MKRHLLAVVCAAVALAWSPSGWSGVIITLESKNLQTHETKQIKLYVKTNRIAYRAKDGSGMIFDGDRQVSWNYDTRHGIYLKMDADNARAIRRQTRRAADKRKEALRREMAQAPAARRKDLKERIESLQPGAPRYKRLGPKKEVGKWRCTPVARVDRSGHEKERMCIASFDDLGIPPKDRKVFDSMDRFVAMMGPDYHSTHSRFTLQAEDALGLHGIAVRDQFAGITTRIVSVRHGTVPDDVFRLPKGLKKITLYHP